MIKDIEFFFKNILLTEKFSLHKRIKRAIKNNYEKELSIVKNFKDKNKDAIDVGVYRGVYSYELGKEFKHVHSFEPNPLLYPFLKKNLTKIIRNMTLYNYAASDATGEIELKIPVQYWLIYEKFAKKFNHNTVLIYFLPDNDFGENDYSNWKGSKRYRPYYEKTDKNTYQTYIPEESVKNYTSTTKKIKKVFKDYFWSSNLFINLNYNYKIYRAKKKKLNGNFSAYFDTSLENQKAAIFFLNKIINSSPNNVILVSIPRQHDFLRFSRGAKTEEIYWNNYFYEKAKSNNKFKFIDLIKFAPKNIDELYLTCDGHWSPKGNLWASSIIKKHLE